MYASNPLITENDDVHVIGCSNPIKPDGVGFTLNPCFPLRLTTLAAYIHHGIPHANTITATLEGRNIRAVRYHISRDKIRTKDDPWKQEQQANKADMYLLHYVSDSIISQVCQFGGLVAAAYLFCYWYRIF